MLINTHCTCCKDTIRTEDAVTCDGCGREVHNRCKQFEQTFDCPKCADELDVGAVEL